MIIKKLTLLFIVFIFTIVYTSSAFAYDATSNIKVGLQTKFKDVTSIKIGNSSILIGYESNGNFHGEVTIKATSSFSVATDNYYYAKENEGLTSYEQAKHIADNLVNSGHKAVVAYTDTGKWAVYLGGYTNKGDAEHTGKTVVTPNNKRTILKDGDTGIILFDNQSHFPQIADSSGGFLKLSDRSYRGTIEFSRFTGGNITAVNVLKIDDYLCSVVASEMPSSWAIEALKAQAVAARNYTVTQRGVHKNLGYDLCDTVHCQSYLGAGNESTSASRAVHETSGVMAFYNNTPINAVYFSSSGGATEDGNKVWGTDTPYLKSVKEINEKTYKEWSRTYTLSELTDIMHANGFEIGNVTSVSLSISPVSGRVSELNFIGTKGKKSIYKEQIRTIFNKSKTGSLDSTNFIISHGSEATTHSEVYVYENGASKAHPLVGIYAMSSSGTPTQIVTGAVVIGKNNATSTYSDTKTLLSYNSTGDKIVFIGKGWGHGAGMSQYGAKGMAEAGYTYEQILKHYYTGIEVRK